jgi:hypothetical protein
VAKVNPEFTSDQLAGVIDGFLAHRYGDTLPDNGEGRDHAAFMCLAFEVSEASYEARGEWL